MFDRLLERNERQLRLEKSKIYRQMLDNQILLNQQYRRKHGEEASNPARSRSKKASSRNKKAQSCERPQGEARVVEKLRLPALEDKQTHYEGSSNFISASNAPTIRKIAISRVKPYSLSPLDHGDSSSEEIEEILSELKTLSRELGKSKQQLRHKRLSSFDARTRRNSRQRERKANIDQSRPANPTSDQDYTAESAPKRPRISLVSVDPKMNGSAPVVKTEPDANPQQLGEKECWEKESGEKECGEKESGASRWEEERDRFIQILKKVRNRGESLFIKLSKFPKQQ